MADDKRENEMASIRKHLARIRIGDELKQRPRGSIDELLQTTELVSIRKHIAHIRKVIDLVVILWIIRELVGFVWFLLGFW